jgi:hypothetical protein
MAALEMVDAEGSVMLGLRLPDVLLKDCDPAGYLSGTGL